MRVSIEHTERQEGMFRKTTYYVVHCKVDFSQEELEIIKQRKLEKTIVMERPVHAHIKNKDRFEGAFNLSISGLMSSSHANGEQYVCATPQDAKMYEAELIEQLKLLNAFIYENVQVEEKSQTFEL